MGNIRKRFENETKVRINILSSFDYGKLNLQRILIKPEIFEETCFVNDNDDTIFPTEILCSSPKSNTITMYLCIKKEKEVLKEIKKNILQYVYEAYVDLINYNANDNTSNNDNKIDVYKRTFCSQLRKSEITSFKKFYEIGNTEKILEKIKFSELIIELDKINQIDNQEILKDRDDIIWKNCFSDFQVSIKKQYEKWLKRISKYYSENEDGYEYINEEKDFTGKYYNGNLSNLCKILYGANSSCALMIERAYIEAPSSKKEYSGSVYINYNKTHKYNMARFIENRVCEDYKELFLLILKSSKDLRETEILKESLNKITLDKRIYCILEEFDNYKELSLKDTDKNVSLNLIDSLKINVSNKLGILQDRIIVTKYFKDIDKNKLTSINTNNDFLKLLTLIKSESEKLAKVIKIKSKDKENIINISLNQERMSVQALMGMLYERYNGYLVDLWKKIIESEEHKKYYYGTIRTIIRNRKDDYKEYRYVCVNNNKSYKRIIDFSLRRGENNDSKKILKMLVNYGYNTIGFDSNENKILINVNGEISQEDKENLINSIKGRLDESAINYFENALLIKVSKKKFRTNSLYKALEVEKSITIDDFYTAFKELFKKMSDNILKYEVYLQ